MLTAEKRKREVDQNSEQRTHQRGCPKTEKERPNGADRESTNDCSEVDGGKIRKGLEHSPRQNHKIQVRQQKEDKTSQRAEEGKPASQKDRFGADSPNDALLRRRSKGPLLKPVE